MMHSEIKPDYHSPLAQWHRCKVVGSSFAGTKLHSALGKLFTPMCLSPSSITWYWSKDSDVLQLGK